MLSDSFKEPVLVVDGWWWVVVGQTRLIVKKPIGEFKSNVGSQKENDVSLKEEECNLTGENVQTK